MKVRVYSEAKIDIEKLARGLTEEDFIELVRNYGSEKEDRELFTTGCRIGEHNNDKTSRVFKLVMDGIDYEKSRSKFNTFK